MKILASYHVDLNQFDKVYSKYQKAVYRNIKKLVHDEELALDILQEVFLKLWENKDKLSNEDSVGGWLFVVSYNKSISHLRGQLKSTLVSSEKVESLLENISEEINEMDEEAELLKMKILEEAISVLPARKKEVFQLYRFEGLSKEEVAEKLEISKETVKDHLKQSNQLIRKYVALKYPSILQLSITVGMMDYFS